MADKLRKYQCFICYRLFDDPNEFREHIVENHEEGRDYILCPSCQYCVRDLKMHFKIKHPNTPLPKNCQMKAIIWKDGNEKKGKRIKKPKFREGYFVSQKNNKEFFYRSGLECQVLELLEQIDKVKQYNVEPIQIEYFFEGKRHEYTPDLSILYENGSIELIEIKPSQQTNLPVNKAKWQSAESYCKARGWGFSVLTEKGINKLKMQVRKIQL